jgi:hypothetical protein
MKKIAGMMVAVAAIALIAVGCGGSGDSTNTSTTPSATSTTTVSAMSNAGLWMSEMVGAIPGALGGTGASVKTTAGSIQCTGTLGGFECVIWDDLGSATSSDHKCDITGSYDDTVYGFDLTYDCYTFEPATGVSVDGNWTASITINNSATATSASKNVYAAKADDSSDCDVENVSNACGETYTFEGGSCTATCGGAAMCTTANAIALVEWTVLERGITMTDACGTYVISAGTTSSMAFCMPSDSQFIMTSTMSGTINGSIIDENIDIDCTFTY